MRLSTDSIRRLGSSHFNYRFGYVANIALVVWLASHAAPLGHTLLSGPAVGASLLTGLGVWTLLEYGLHRFVYHVIPSFLQIGHRLHHEHPKALIGIPWYLSSVLVIAVFELLWAACPHPALAASCAATWLGYIGYCILHHASHHWPMRRGYLRRMKRHHLVHHAHPDYNWGFTTAFWDRIFGTAWAPEDARPKRRIGNPFSLKIVRVHHDQAADPSPRKPPFRYRLFGRASQPNLRQNQPP